jgi:ABC-type phosphate/phosphonate transport system substrate-binding protein
MYNAGPRAAAAWRALFERVFAEAGVAIDWIEHRWPQPIAELWGRPDLGCDFMCGWPFIRSGQMLPIAVPVPSPPRYEHRSRYCSEFLVREASGWQRLEEAFGHRFGWMAADSQSGFNAPRAHLARFVTPERPALFAKVRGPLGSPVKALEALHAGEVDAIALDSYFLDLCRWHEPGRLKGIASVAATEWTPMPLLVAAPATPRASVDALRDLLPTIHERPEYRPLLADVLLERFEAPRVEAYGQLEAMARFAAERDYDVIS